MKLVSFERLSVLNLHYFQYSLDYFLDRMVDLGIKNVELLGGHQGMWLDPNEYQDPEPILKKLQSRNLHCPVFTPQNCRFGYQFGVKEPELRKKTFGFFSNGIKLAAALGAIQDGVTGMSRKRKDLKEPSRCIRCWPRWRNRTISPLWLNPCVLRSRRLDTAFPR